jgi:polar amino acid transport system permease protein
MTAEKKGTSETTASSLEDVRAKMGQIPLVRRHSFVYSFLTLLVLYAAFVLPDSGPPAAGQLSVIVLFTLLLVAWAVIVFTDELKPELLKTAVAFAVLIVSAWLYYRYSTAQWGEMTGLFFNLKVIQKAWPTLVEGFWTTLLLAVAAAVMSTIIGLLLAVFRSFNNTVLNVFIIAYVDFFRAMPIIVLMMLIYYALPFLGIRLSAIMSGILALGLNSSAYVSEIFRAGFLSIKKGQIEAAHALGLNAIQTMRLVLLPQAFRVVIPPLVGNYVACAKDTALASSISIIELLKAGLSQKSLLANPSPLIFVTVLYLVMFVPLTRFSGVLEKRMKASQRQIRL